MHIWHLRQRWTSLSCSTPVRIGAAQEKMMNTVTKGTALVTGASSGIGAIYADRLAHRGYDLILVARNHQRLDRLAKQLSDDTGRAIEVLPADLGNKSDLARVEAVLRSDASITLLLNNAGVGSTAALLDADIQKVDSMIALNVEALTRLTYAAAPGFVARGGGSIINISSISALAPEIILNGVYSATKAYVLVFSQSLHHELKDKGVRIQAVLPGATVSDFWDIAGVPLAKVPSHILMPVEEMVDAALAGFDQGEFVTIPSLPDNADWLTFENARAHLTPNLSRSMAADRYRRDV